jgi:cysteine-rich repeat protein
LEKVTSYNTPWEESTMAARISQREVAKTRTHLFALAVRAWNTICLAFIGALLLSTSATAQPHVVAALGKAKVQGEKVLVEVLVVVHPGQNGRDAARAALAAQGADPVDDAAFTTSGLVWEQLPVTQNYNPGKEPVSLGGLGQAALEATHATWNGVATSRAKLELGGTTGRCPSLVRECKGPQRFDGNNDVAWLSIGGCCTLGVTWFGTTIDEADMALNTNFSWANDGVSDFDAQTVFLHENGHVLGLDHSSVEGAVMEPSYEGIRRTLNQDDEDGITYLYPCDGPCGDGVLGSGEECDDGNCKDGDGCSSMCMVEAYCGDGFCDAGEDRCNCPADCGLPEVTEANLCTDGIDNDCDSLTDCRDPDCNLDPGCQCGQKGESCEVNADCCSNSCKGKPGSKTCK